MGNHVPARWAGLRNYGPLGHKILSVSTNDPGGFARYALNLTRMTSGATFNPKSEAFTTDYADYPDFKDLMISEL